MELIRCDDDAFSCPAILRFFASKVGGDVVQNLRLLVADGSLL
jgi:hypothetical protein